MKSYLRFVNLGLVLSLLIVATPNLAVESIVSDNYTAPSSLSYDPEQNYVVTFVNYDQDYISESSISSYLMQSELAFLSYTINYEFQYANSSYESEINTYIDSISQEDWTSKLNETALKEQQDNFGRKDIFTKQNGTAIDARALENYLKFNKPTSNLADKNRFNIFVFNLSRLDFGDKKHWFNVTEVDPDSGKSRFYWRLEWDYPLNYDVKFPFPAFSENSDIAIMDPTAFQWYLNWRQIWSSAVNYHSTYNNTLTELLDGKTASESRIIVSDAIGVWLDQWIDNLFNMAIGPLEELGNTIDIQLISVYNSSQKSKEELEWIINSNSIKQSTDLILNPSQVDINITYVDIEQDPYMSNYVDSKEVSYNTYQGMSSPFEDWTYYDGVSIWNDIAFNGEVTTKYFQNTQLDIPVRGIVLLLQNASYVGSGIPWSGGLYTGLGGANVVTMLWELGRAFMPDGNTHKAGLSKVLIHEIGHSIGYPHTFNSGKCDFISDFISDVMGYYPGTSNYSQLLVKKYQRDSADSLMNDLFDLYDIISAQNETSYDPALKITSIKFDRAKQMHQARLYLDSYNEVLDAIHVLQNPLDYDEDDVKNELESSSSTIPTSNPKESDDSSLNYYGSKFIILLLLIPLSRKLYNKTR